MHFNPTYDALLRTVLDDPTNAEARAVLADAHEEAGRTAAAALVRGETEGVEAWMGSLPPAVAEALPERCPFVGGVPAWVSGRIGKLVQKSSGAHIDAFLSVHGAHRLNLRGRTKRPSQLGARAGASRVRELRWLDNQLDDEGLSAVAPVLVGPATVLLEKYRGGDAGLDALLPSARLKRVELLNPVHGGQFTAAGVTRLLDPERFPALRALAISGAYRVKTTELAKSPALQRLEHLELYTSDALGLLADASMPSMRTFIFRTYMDRTTDDQVQRLARNLTLDRIERIVVRLPMDRELAPDTVRLLRDRFGAAFET